MNIKHHASRFKVLIWFSALLLFGLLGVVITSSNTEADEIHEGVIYEEAEITSPEVLYEMAENGISDETDVTTEIAAQLTNVNTKESVDAETVETTQHLSTQQEEDGSTTETYVTTVFLDEVSAEDKEKVDFEGEIGVNNTTEGDIELFAADTYGEQFSPGYDTTKSVRAYAKIYYRTGIISSGPYKGVGFLDLTAVKGTWQNSNSSVTIRDRKVYGKAEYFFWDGSRGTELKTFYQSGDTGPIYETNTKAILSPMDNGFIRCSSVCTLTKGSSTWSLIVSTSMWS